MTKLLIGTGNPGKVREYRALLASWPVELVTPADLGLEIDPEETGETFAANAVLKARAYAAAGEVMAIADDSGLEVDALDGFPGVRSNRWHPGSDADRVAALLERLAEVPDPKRGAHFKAVAALARPDGQVVTGVGTVEGRIAHAPRGAGGFGYDPVFLVEDGGHDGTRTLAELSADEKNRLSHRARAVAALARRLGEVAGGVR